MTNYSRFKVQSNSPNVYSPMASLAFRASFFFGLISLGFLILFSIGEGCNTKYFLDVLGILIVTAFASFASGGIIGFLFGIPHSIQQNTPISNNLPTSTNSVATSTNASGDTNDSSTAMAQKITTTPAAVLDTNHQAKLNYTPSTNLEQIADWLTKIIVGVGLIEIHKIINLFNQFCLELGKTLEHYSATQWNGSLVIGCIIILFSIEGFLMVYLWTYVYLIRIQESMSKNDVIDTINSKIAETDTNDKIALDLASKQLSLPDGAPDLPISDLTQAFSNASKSVLSTIFYKAVTIRKQFWNDETTKFKIEKTIPIFRALIATDNNFEFPENYAELAFVLKDQRTPDYQQALNNLNRAIDGFRYNDRIVNKAITYFNRAYCKIKVDPNFCENPPAISSVENKKSITDDLTEASKETYVKAIILNDPIDPTIKTWMNLNSVTIS
jgi:tetratricopeptide (TPR) repeat protein